MNHFTIKKIRLFFMLFFLALALPSTILSFKAYEQLRWQALHQYQLDAQVLVQQIDTTLLLAINKEEARADTDYTFFVLAGNADARFVQRSELSKYPVQSDLSGITGYFQIDEQGEFSSPILPSEYVQSAAYPKLYGISVEENRQRKILLESIKNILLKNELVNRKPHLTVLSDGEQDDALEEDTFEKGLQEVTSPQLMENKIMPFSQLAKKEKSRKQNNVAKKSSKNKAKLDVSKSAFQQKIKKSRKNRLEKNYSPQQSLVTKNDMTERVQQNEIQIKLFESEIEPFKFKLLSSGHFVAFREVLRNNKRVIQGAVLSSNIFLDISFKQAFEQSPLSDIANLSIKYDDIQLKNYSFLNYRSQTIDIKEQVLAPISLSEPFSSLSLSFTIKQLSDLPGATFIKLISLGLMLIVILGTYLLYRLALKQNRLTQLQQDFVSSVSHELKTPLTSIRMYGEILKQGWVSEEKKALYYDYIFTESERLSRLISNILQISKVSHNALNLEIQEVTIKELISLIESKVDSQIKLSDFTLNINSEPTLMDKTILVNTDALVQIAINLVDNVIKYAAKSDNKKIEVTFSKTLKGNIYLSVRDYGPGINKNQLKTVFELFYRSGDELTREVTGTGIGLALVKELANAMSAKVEAVNHNVGLELIITFK